MPVWLTNLNDIGSISSILGVIVTVFLFIEARSIRNTFLVKARLPELIKELTKEKSLLSKNIKTWKQNKNPAIENLLKIKALLDNSQSKLQRPERKKVKRYLSLFEPKRLQLFKIPLERFTDEQVWELFNELGGLITSLQQLPKDLRW